MVMDGWMDGGRTQGGRTIVDNGHVRLDRAEKRMGASKMTKLDEASVGDTVTAVS
jgi:hypothetical protein